MERGFTFRTYWFSLSDIPVSVFGKRVMKRAFFPAFKPERMLFPFSPFSLKRRFIRGCFAGLAAMTSSAAARLKRVNEVARALARVDYRAAQVIAGEFVKREKELYNRGVDAHQVLNEILDSLDSELSPGENINIALRILDRYARERESAMPDSLERSQAQEALARYEDLLFKREAGGLSEEEELELKELERFLRLSGALKLQRDEPAVEWTQLLRASASEYDVIEVDVDLPDKVTLLRRVEAVAQRAVSLL